VFIALQNQLENNPHEILLARYDNNNNTLVPFEMPKDIAHRLQGYIGSIVLDSSQTVIAATSPRGNCGVFYTINGEFLYPLNNDDVCGVQAGKKTREFVLSNGKGELIHCLAGATLTLLSTQHYPNTYWDNHLTYL
jgi:hypothetical protein